jgi:hypothetical protein
MQPVEISATVSCTTHKRAAVKVEWHIERVDDSDLAPEAASPHAPEDTPRARVTADMAMHKVSTMGRTMASGARARFAERPRRTDAFDDARVAGPQQDVADVFIGAGALKRELEVGTEAGSKSSALQGMLLQHGTYEACFRVVSVWEAPAGARLPVNDYAISHALRICVAEGGDADGGDTPASERL